MSVALLVKNASATHSVLSEGIVSHIATPLTPLTLNDLSMFTVIYVTDDPVTTQPSVKSSSG